MEGGQEDRGGREENGREEMIKAEEERKNGGKGEHDKRGCKRGGERAMEGDQMRTVRGEG